jgi:hypothetical protein
MVAARRFANLSPFFPKLDGDAADGRDEDPALRAPRMKLGGQRVEDALPGGQGTAALRLPRAQPLPADRPQRGAGRHASAAATKIQANRCPKPAHLTSPLRALRLSDVVAGGIFLSGGMTAPEEKLCQDVRLQGEGGGRRRRTVRGSPGSSASRAVACRRVDCSSLALPAPRSACAALDGVPTRRPRASRDAPAGGARLGRVCH